MAVCPKSRANDETKVPADFVRSSVTLPLRSPRPSVRVRPLPTKIAGQCRDRTAESLPAFFAPRSSLSAEVEARQSADGWNLNSMGARHEAEGRRNNASDSSDGWKGPRVKGAERIHIKAHFFQVIEASTDMGELLLGVAKDSVALALDRLRSDKQTT
jgi:hypothetical protein